MRDKIYNLGGQENQAVSDAYSMLSGNIYMESENKKIKSIVITSSEPKTGKTSVATSLAITMASWGKRIILIDADMRKRNDSKVLKKGSDFGLSQYLNGSAEFEEVLCDTNFDGLMYIPNGSIALNPIGLICSSRFVKLLESLKNEFDYILLDTPPLDAVSDAAVISAKVDSVLLVAKMGKTDLASVNRAKEKLEKANANLLGVVINTVNKRHYKRYLNSYKYFYNDKNEIGKNEKSNKKAVTA
ncbi:MAG: CpsD/CapB family tyrosine-protein kinase [Clostridiaceae bacterium]|nr:CpsD/CapB family tyrosine-protein kinase [Clostridiaceae bacterium]